MSVLFKDDDFSKACDELDVPNVTDYEFFTETHDVKIYRKYNKESYLYQYKIYGALKNISPEICAQVYMDLEYRKKWDTYVAALKEVEDDGEKAIYWKVNFPFPLSNRDYVYRRELRQLNFKDRPAWVILAQSVKVDSVPPHKGVVRVEDYVQSMAITSDGNIGTKGKSRVYSLI
ncbi:Phosphatidylcholine transfer protein [Lamellibrachia satsuma]|nr:Phosphatidylcholine transfer protein [Lamellibrachia satsuma]